MISELVRPRPALDVEAYLRALPPDEVLTSAICEAEIRYGVSKLPAGKRRTRLAQDIDALLTHIIRVVPFDSASADAYGHIRSSCETSGKPIETEDAMIAAVARVLGATLVTRNVRHFRYCGIKVVDPWTSRP